MADLLVLAREFDLPPRWDGGLVEWGPWEPTPRMFICPAPDDMGACDKCGSLEERVRAQGLVHPLPGEGDRPTVRLHAARCPDCSHDVVVDLDTNEVWDLDPSDYTVNGSWHPGDVEPEPEPEPEPVRRPTPVRAPRRTVTTSTKTARPRARHDGSCTACDDLHPPGSPCGRPAPPPPGWRPNLKGTHHG